MAKYLNEDFVYAGSNDPSSRWKLRAYTSADGEEGRGVMRCAEVSSCNSRVYLRRYMYIYHSSVCTGTEGISSTQRAFKITHDLHQPTY